MEPLQFTIQDGNGELTKEEFLRGAREDQSVIDVLSLYQRDEIAQQPLISTSNTQAEFRGFFKVFSVLRYFISGLFTRKYTSGSAQNC